MTHFNLSRFDLIDRLKGYSFEHTTKHKLGHTITYEAIAIDDVVQALDEFMNEDDYFKIISYEDFKVNNLVWHNNRINKITNINDKEIEIFDLETKVVRTVNSNCIRHCS